VISVVPHAAVEPLEQRCVFLRSRPPEGPANNLSGFGDLARACERMRIACRNIPALGRCAVCLPKRGSCFVGSIERHIE